MYKYLEYIKKDQNIAVVVDIITQIQETDVINVEVIKANLDKLEKLKEIGEVGVYKALRQDMKEDPIYKDNLL